MPRVADRTFGGTDVSDIDGSGKASQVLRLSD